MKTPKGGNQNPYIEEEDNTMARKVQKDKQRSTKHTYKTKDRVTRTSLKTGGELRCSGRVSDMSKKVPRRYAKKSTKTICTKKYQGDMSKKVPRRYVKQSTKAICKKKVPRRYAKKSTMAVC